MNTNGIRSDGHYTSEARAKCLVMMRRPPGGGPGSLRVRPDGVTGRALGLLRRLAVSAVQLNQAAFHIRGVEVASDYIVEALLRESRRASFTMMVPDTLEADFVEWSRSYTASYAGGSPDICTIHQQLAHRRWEASSDLLLELHGVSSLSFQLRNQFATKPFPTITLQHGFSDHTLLYDSFLRCLLTRHFEFDSLVCTSVVSKRALENIFNTVSDRFNVEFGTKLQLKARVDVIPLCVDTDRLTPSSKGELRRTLKVPSTAFVLLYVGYVSQVKADMTSLLAITHRLRATNPSADVRLVIAGTGPENHFQELTEVVGRLGMSRVVRMVRDLSDRDKGTWFAAADVFVGPCQNLQEAFGLAPVEAMACGLPQVAADWSGYRETIVHGETGFLVPTVWDRCDSDLHNTGDLLGWKYEHVTLGQSVATDINSFVEYIRLLIGKPELREAMAERSRRRAVSQFGYASVARQYDDLFDELLLIRGTSREVAYRQTYDQPGYCDSFQHFATHMLDDSWQIIKGAFNDIALADLVLVANSETFPIQTLDIGLLRRLEEALSEADRTTTYTVASLASTTTDDRWSVEMVRRHILYLLKHGRAQVIRADPEVTF